MYTFYGESKSGHADQKVVQTLSKEVSRIITEQVKQSMSENSDRKQPVVQR